ncbi:PIN domain-containing protein [Vibrio jasicida]|uniref:PIN domain-containing protein n=1 Tax=Vibrio jasicida TaxID=766224 RepID=UPI000CE4E66B|nr:PIN domain-containing protein [Vibrio jasicida]
MTDKQNEKNIFMLEEIFPDASGIFSAKHKKLNECYESALIVFDTNVLLLPYSMRNESLSLLKDLYKSLIDSERLFIPNRVAREFAKNRNKKLGDIYNSVLSQKKGKTKNELKYPILESLDEKQELDKKYEKLLEAEKEFYSSISKLASTIRSWEWGDPVSSMYSELFEEKVFIDHDKSNNELIAELERRFKLQIPPGYKDAKKDDGGIGDLAIWLSLTKLGRDKVQDVIFVTEDVKPDWWNQSNGSEFLPRFELIDEFRRDTNGCTLHMVRLSKLLELFSVQKELIQETVNAEKERKNRLFNMLERFKKAEEQRKEAIYSNLSKEEALVEMEMWFHSNYADPAEMCPFESREGGYQYIWGGPYDAEEQLFAEFGGYVKDSVIEQLVSKLNDECLEWSGRPEEPEPDDYFDYEEYS